MIENKLAASFPKKEEGKLNIYFHLGENSGVGYYRQYLPAVALRERGLANVMISDFRWGIGNHQEPDADLLFEIANWADVIVVGRRDQAQFYAQWGAVREMFRVPVILDTDDNIRAVPIYNPGYSGYQPGSDALAWNQYASQKTFDAISVTTQDLRTVYSKDNPRTYILPNSLDCEAWEKAERPAKDGVVKIGFIGSAAHLGGVNIIRQAVVDILGKYPSVEFYITHVYLPSFDDVDPEIRKRIKPVPWINLEEWPKGLTGLGLDIGLAPLEDNLFNRSKSNLRWMEYSMAGMATIASPVRPYLCVNDGEDGLLAPEKKDWFDAMDRLLSNPELCYTISQKARQRVLQEFDIRKNIPQWLEIYQKVHDKYHEFYGKKRRYELVKAGKERKYQELK